jgi:DNA-binding transcriptional ArsR family regulator
MTYVTNAFAALADSTRRTIFERLIEHPSAVSELARELPVSRPAVSQHLRVLKEAGLVLDTRDGTRRLYQLDPAGVARLRAHFDQVWTRALSAFEIAASKAPASPKKKKGGQTHAGNRSQRRRS